MLLIWCMYGMTLKAPATMMYASTKLSVASGSAFALAFFASAFLMLGFALHASTISSYRYHKKRALITFLCRWVKKDDIQQSPPLMQRAL
jgi:hypothetical protein